MVFDYFLGIRRAPKNLRVTNCKFGKLCGHTKLVKFATTNVLQIYYKFVTNLALCGHSIGDNHLLVLMFGSLL